MTNVIPLPSFAQWLEELHDKDADAVARYVGLLREKGVALGFPFSSNIEGSSGMRELRVQSRGKPIRVFYMFDPKRNAVLLLGGHKGGNEKRFYLEMVPKAEAAFREYLSAQPKTKH